MKALVNIVTTEKHYHSLDAVALLLLNDYGQDNTIVVSA